MDLGPDAQVERNERFHDGVIAAAGNPRLTQLSRASRQYFFNHRIARSYTREENRRSIEGHRRILPRSAAATVRRRRRAPASTSTTRSRSS